MSRASFGRTVARAAASGGSRSYRARRPAAWYLLMFVIVAGGIGLIAYSRNERLHPAAASTASGPVSSSNWQTAYAVDICGTLEPALPASKNLAASGVRTFGDGLINTDPGAATTPANYEGAKATVGLFASKYTGFTLSATSIHYPLAKQKTWTDGEACTGPLKGKGTLVAKVWSSPSATGTIYAGAVTAIPLRNGEMVTLAFVPASATASIPEPASKSALEQSIGSTSSSSSTTLGPTTTVAKKTAKS